MWSDLRYRLSVLFGRRSRENELAAELELHLELQAEKHVKSGMSHDDAVRQARLEFGAMERAKEECRDARGIGFVERTASDLSYAIRTLKKSPAFVTVAILSLALGAGVNTAVFSVVYGVLLRPLPYPTPNRLLRVSGSSSGRAVSFPALKTLQDESTTFSAVAGYRGGGDRQLISTMGGESVPTLVVTTDFIRTLGVPLAMGREFNKNETQRGGQPAAIISDRLWKSAFGGDPTVLGRELRLNSIVYTIVGVLPQAFWFPQAADALLPLIYTGSLSDTGINTNVLSRLKDGVTLAQAQAELDRLSRDVLHNQKPEAGADFQAFTATVFQDWLVGDVRLNLELLFGATAALLLIACSNLATLMMTRLTGRRLEFAVRLAIGGSTTRLLRQLFVENLLLAAAGTLAGLVSGYALLRALMATIPFNLPSSEPIQINGTVLVFTTAVAFITTAFFTVAPFLSSGRVDCGDMLRTGCRTIGTSKRRARNALVIAEVALSGMLLTSAGLLINSLYRLHQEQLGFKAAGLMTVSTQVSGEASKNRASLAAFTQQTLDALNTVGLSNAAAVNVAPLTGQSNFPTQRFGHPENSIGGMEVRLVSPNYFQVMGIPLKRGRAFNEQDRDSGQLVAIVSESVDRRWWPNSDPIGDQVILGRFADKNFHIEETPRQVIGVVGDTKIRNLTDPPRPTIYIPIAQTPDSLVSVGGLTWILGTDQPSVVSGARRVLSDIVGSQRLGEFRTIDDLIAANIGNWRFNAYLFGLFAAVAVALAAIGIFGLLSYTVAQSRQEIGMRMALGARRADVASLVLRQGLSLISVGLALGLTGALFATRLLAKLLYHIRPNDPLTYAAVALLLLGVGLVASFIPARRATRLDPMAALRH